MAGDLVYDSSLVAVVVIHDTVFEFACLLGTFRFKCMPESVRFVYYPNVKPLLFKDSFELKIKHFGYE